MRELSFKDFVDLKKLNEKIGTADKRSSNDDKMGDIKIIKISKENPYKILYKMSYSGEHFRTLDIKISRTTVNKGNDGIELKLYSQKLKLADKKKNGLVDFLCINISIFNNVSVSVILFAFFIKIFLQFL